MKRDRRRSLRLERLEGKALLSAVHGLSGGPALTSAGTGAGATAGSVSIQHAGLGASSNAKAAGSVAIHHTGLDAATFARTTNPGGAARRIRPLGKLQLMTLSTNVSAGGFGTSALLPHDAAAGPSLSVRGLTHGPILASTRGVAVSTGSVRVGSSLDHFSIPNTSGLGSTALGGSAINAAVASPLKTI